MRNRFKGICYRCGSTVEKGAGHFERYRKQLSNGSKVVRWRVQHAECAIKYRGTNIHYIDNPDTTES